MDGGTECTLLSVSLYLVERTWFDATFSNLLCLGEHTISEAGLSSPAHITAAPLQR